MIYERIEKSLNQAIKLHNSGLSANESVIKVARDNELNPETISRVVEAFNIAKTKAYVKVAQDKAADFDIADKKKVIRAVFSDEPVSKTASEQPISGAGYLKIASTLNEREEQFVACRTSEVSLESRIKMAYQAIEEQNRELAEKRHEVIECKEEFYAGLKKAVDTLEYYNERENLSKYAAEIFYQHSDNSRAGKVFSLICKCAKIDPSNLTDKLGGGQNYGNGEFIDAFDRALQADANYSDLSARYNELVRESSDKQAELKGMVFRIGNVPQKDASSLIGAKQKISKKASHMEFPEDLLNDVLGSLFDAPKSAETEPMGKSASLMLKFSNLSDIVGEVPKLTPDISSMVPDNMKPVQEMAGKGYMLKLQGKDSPVREERAKIELENMKREMILRDLMRDEIISQQNPKEIENTYNAMIQLAPNASMIKDVVRSVLRQGTAQVIDPHFANTLVELENNIVKGRDLALGKGS